MNTSTEHILNRIEFLRNRMINVAQEKGFTDSESIHISQELDLLLNLYEKEKSQEKSKGQ